MRRHVGAGQDQAAGGRGERLLVVLITTTGRVEQRVIEVGTDLLGDEEEGYASLERGSVVRTGLEGLEERERRIVVLRFLKGLTQSEIAAELGISQMHVSRLLRRALAAMHGRLDEGDGVPL